MDAGFEERCGAAEQLLAEGKTTYEIRKEIKRAYGQGIGQGTLMKLQAKLGMRSRSAQAIREAKIQTPIGPPSVIPPNAALAQDFNPARPKGREQYSVYMEVTPELAAKWLTQNVHNRPVRPLWVEMYASDVGGRAWQLTHQGIAFDWNDVLGDGQHRLMAIVQAKKTIRQLVTFNLDPAAMVNIDGGPGRGVGDQLALVDGRLLAIIVLRAFYAHCHGHQLEVIKTNMLGIDTPTVQKAVVYFQKVYR